MSESARRIAELQRELTSHPGSRQFYQLGELLRREGRSTDAAEALRAGLAHHPRYVAAWVALGRACVESGEAAEAVEGLEQALALDRQNPVAWRLLGEAYLALGDRPAALEAWKQCIELVPGDDVLQAAVDALSAEVEASPAPAAPEAGPDAGAPRPEPFVTEAAAAPQLPAAIETVSAQITLGPPGAPAAPDDAPPVAEEAVPVVTTKLRVQRFDEPPAEVPPAAPGPEVQGAVGQEAIEDLFPEASPSAPPHDAGAPEAAEQPLDDVLARPAPETPRVVSRPGAQPPPALDRPAPPAAAQGPAGEAGDEEELFTAPESEQAPTVLKAVLGAPSGPISSKVPAPPATLALARLYVQQQALDEAAQVLERLLEREPGNTEAQDLLSLVRDMMEPLPAAPPPLSRRERKIAALQHWLACLTLGRERATR
jgi:tetratricopeptide (TPR) repeat protein